MSWVLAFLGFALLIILHELGHFAAAKAVGMRVERFSLFFPPLLARHRRGETEYAVGAIPLGGYVKFAGDMNPASQPDAAWLSLPAHERARTFQAKPVWQRAIVVAAGPFVNLALAVLILGGFAAAYGDARMPAVVGSIQPGSAAAQAGLRPGDRVEALGGTLELFSPRGEGTVLTASIPYAGDDVATAQPPRPTGLPPVRHDGVATRTPTVA